MDYEWMRLDDDELSALWQRRADESHARGLEAGEPLPLSVEEFEMMHEVLRREGKGKRPSVIGMMKECFVGLWQLLWLLAALLALGALWLFGDSHVWPG